MATVQRPASANMGAKLLYMVKTEGDSRQQIEEQENVIKEQLVPGRREALATYLGSLKNLRVTG